MINLLLILSGIISKFLKHLIVLGPDQHPDMVQTVQLVENIEANYIVSCVAGYLDCFVGELVCGCGVDSADSDGWGSSALTAMLGKLWGGGTVVEFIPCFVHCWGGWTLVFGLVVPECGCEYFGFVFYEVLHGSCGGYTLASESSYLNK